MEYRIDIDGARISEMIHNRYEETKRRLIKFNNKYRLASDKEIIEYLAEEIEQYRNRIEKQQEYIEKLKNKQTILDIREDKTELKEIEQIEDDNIQEIEIINKFADGRLIQSISNYKYKDKPKDKLKAIYKAEIFEYESGRIDTMYECDKENNDECSKESCTSYHCCNHTLNIKYAKNYINEKYNN